MSTLTGSDYRGMTHGPAPRIRVAVTVVALTAATLCASLGTAAPASATDSSGAALLGWATFPSSYVSDASDEGTAAEAKNRQRSFMQIDGRAL